MSAHRWLEDETKAPWVRLALAASAVGPSASSGEHRIIVAASTNETNSIPDPVAPGLWFIPVCTVLGASGKRTMTFVSPFDSLGHTVIVFNLVRQAAWFYSVPDASTATKYRWELLVADASVTDSSVTRETVKNLAAQYDIASSTVLADPGLALNVVAGKTYRFKAYMLHTVGATGGLGIAMGGTATATSVGYNSSIWSNTTDALVAAANETALGAGAVLTYNTDTSLWSIMEGTIVVNAAGTLGPIFAQKTSNATNSSVLLGSYFELTPVG